MRGLLVALFVLVASLASAQGIRVGTPVVAEWDYTQVDLDCTGCEGGIVVRFEYRLDAGAWTNTGFPTLPPGHYEFIVPDGSKTGGKHTFSVRGCTATLCGTGSDVANFTYTVDVLAPRAPRNLTIRPGEPPQELNLEQAIGMAHAYHCLLKPCVPLTEAQIFELAREYDGPIPFTNVSVLTFLDTKAETLRQ